MTILAPKRPAETVRYIADWSHQLRDDTIESYTLARATGDVVLGENSFAAQSVTMLLSGGTDGVTSTFDLVVTTFAGQVLHRTLSMLVSSTAIAVYPSTTTKGQIEDMAFEEIGLAGYEFDATAEEQASGLRRFDSLMAMWAGPGMNLDLGYNFPAAVGGSSRTDASGIPDMALDGVVVSLALSISPGIGKSLSVETKTRYQQSMNAIRAAFATIPERQLPRSTGRGAGAKPWSTWQPFIGSGVG